MNFFSAPDDDERARIEQMSEAFAAKRASSRIRETDGRRERLGKIFLGAGVGMLMVMSFCPAPYVIRQPGPVVDALGTVTLEAGQDQSEVITIGGDKGHEPTSGQLDILTVNVAGNPQSEPTWFETLVAWGSHQHDVLPVEAYYADGESADQRNEATSAEMASSQDLARVAALRDLGYEVKQELVVSAVGEGMPAAGILQPGDVILKAAEQPVTSTAELRELIAAHGAGTPIELTIRRDDVEQHVSVTPQMLDTKDGARPAIGVAGGPRFPELPVDIQIGVGNVGGPSAGLMLTLAIEDKLTPGDFTGGHHIAGTGTIDETGKVGPIGGIRQKYMAAREVGAEAFLAPRDNCAEVVDEAEPKLPVYAVDDLVQAKEIVTLIAQGGVDAPAAAGFASCQAVAAR